MSTTFAQLGVPTFICDALERRGITEPFAIQAATVTDLLAGRDVCGRAPTGAGKTLAFGVPLIATTERGGPRRPSALVLAPTRELADQICAELRTFSGRLRVDVVYGGVGYGKQVAALNRGVDVLVACPGRLEDLIGGGKVDLGAVRTVVLDEADRMADMGFVPAVRRLLDQTPRDRRTVLFSATLDGDVATLTRDYQRDPVRHEVGEETPDVRSATHRFWRAERADRNPIVAEVVAAAWPSIVFTRTRHGADRLAKQLGRFGLETAPIHGGRSQSQRNRALADFSNGRVHALIATDVAARGIHVDGVASVIHYDPPDDHKAYVHRSGRTARAGATGLVVSLVQPDQQREARRLIRDIGLDADLTEVASGGVLEHVPGDARSNDRVLAHPAPAPTGRAQGAPTGGKQRSGTSRKRSTRSDGERSGRGERGARGATPSGGAARDGERSGRGERGARGATSSGGAARDDRRRRDQRGGSPKQGKNGGNRSARRAHLRPR